MFDRITYKKVAKQQLKNRYRWPVLMTLIILVITYCIRAASYSNLKDSLHFSTIPAAGYTFALLMNHLQLFMACIVICIVGILTIAQQFVYLKLARTVEKSCFNDFLAGLELWLKGMLGMIWYCFWTMLWSILFVIPGIVKAVSYSQMFRIMAENRNIGIRRAMQISKVMTMGHKGDLFVMALSFLGWAALCIFTVGIGYLWLIPYSNMSFTNAYFALKNQAFASGKLTPADFTR